jgi:membrane protein DedA with SNARE-associated domain
VNAGSEARDLARDVGDDRASEVRAEPPSSRLAKPWIIAFAAVMVSRGAGVALLPLLLVEAPAVLVSISPVVADLLLAAVSMPAWLYFVAATTSSLVHSTIAYEFGAVLGKRAQVWLEGWGAVPHGVAERILRWMKRAAPIVVVALGSVSVCAFAGVSRLRRAVFYPTMIVGQIGWVFACFWFGAALSEPLAVVRAFIESHVLELTAVGLVWVGGGELWRRHRRRRKLAEHL